MARKISNGCAHHAIEASMRVPWMNGLHCRPPNSRGHEMTIWIGNATRQELQIEARLPEMTKIFPVKISSGKQAEVRGLSPAQEEGLIRHILRFGAAKRQDLHGKIKTFAGIVYATDKPMKMDEFHYGFEEVLDHAENRSVEQAVRSAQAADLKARENSQGRVLETEVEMVEEKPADPKKGRRMKITVDPKTSNQTIPLQ